MYTNLAMTTTTLWTVLLAMVLVVVAAAVAGEHVQTESICSGKSRIYLNSTTTLHLLSPSEDETVDIYLGCQVQIGVESPFHFLKMRVVSFNLGGRDPCYHREETLTITSYPHSYYYRGDVDTMRWCGQSYSPVTTAGVPLILGYIPGPDTRRRGSFEIVFTAVRGEQVCGTESMTVGNEPMYIYHPGYPAPYPDGVLDCQWELKAENGGTLLLESLQFDLEAHGACRYDYLKIEDQKYCGDQRIQVRSRRDTMNLFFVSDFSEAGMGFVLKVRKNSEVDATCNREIILDSSPLQLTVPNLNADSPSVGFDCWWILDAGSDNSVVMLDTSHFYTTAYCDQFYLKVYDGQSNMSPRIFSKCAPLQMFQTIRSSSRFLYVDVSLGYGRYRVDVAFTAVSSPRNPPPRVLYAGSADSYVWVNLTSFDELGILIRGSEDNPWNYTSCIELRMTETLSVSYGNVTDFCSAYSGWNASFADLGRGCGRTSSTRVLSYGSKIFLDVSRVQRYGTFWLLYTLQQYCQPEMIILQSESRFNQTLESDKVFNSLSYPNNAYCQWLIKPRFSFHFTKVLAVQSQLKPGGCYDNITIYDYDVDGVSGKQDQLLDWCGAEKGVVLSSEGNGLLVEFITNFQHSGRGFVLNYSSVVLVDECPTMATFMAEEDPKFLTSPNYPNHYPNNVECKWLIKSDTSAIKITLLFISIAQEAAQCMGYDVLVVYDGWHTSSPVLVDRCGNGIVHSEFFSTSNHVLIHFMSDSQNTARGFRLQYQTTEDAASGKCDRTVQLDDNEDIEISSPYYPNSFPSQTDCYWLVHAAENQQVKLEVLDFDIPNCSKSPVLLYDGDSENSLLLARLCGSTRDSVYSSSQNSMYIRFRANGNTGKGFSFGLSSRPNSGDGCKGVTPLLMAYMRKSYISSPNYPRDYPPDANCAWRIESAYSNMTIRIDVEDAKLESSFTCNFDSVSIYDGYGELSTRLGKFCGDHMATYWSRGTYMYVHFQSDSTSQFRGFRLAYWAVTRSGAPTSSTSQTNSGIGGVVGGVMGGVIFLLVGITIFLCVLKQCKQRRAQRSSQPNRQTSREDRRSTVFVMNPVIVNQMPPPPYPGLTNAGYVGDDMPPAYPSGQLALAAPPFYTELDAPPPYSETMLESHPPSSPKPKEGQAPFFFQPGPGQGEYSSLQAGRGPEHQYQTLAAASAAGASSPTDQQPRHQQQRDQHPWHQQPQHYHPPREQQQDQRLSYTELLHEPPTSQQEPHNASPSSTTRQQQQDQQPLYQQRSRWSPTSQQEAQNSSPSNTTEQQQQDQQPTYEQPSRRSPPSQREVQSTSPSSATQQQGQEPPRAPVPPRALQGRAPTGDRLQMRREEDMDAEADDADQQMAASYV